MQDFSSNPAEEKVAYVPTQDETVQDFYSNPVPGVEVEADDSP